MADSESHIADSKSHIKDFWNSNTVKADKQRGATRRNAAQREAIRTDPKGFRRVRCDAFHRQNPSGLGRVREYGYNKKIFCRDESGFRMGE